MVVTAAVVPQTIVLMKHQCVATPHRCHHRVDAIGSSPSLHTGNETGHTVVGFLHSRIAHTPIPPRHVVPTTYCKTTINDQSTVFHGKNRLLHRLSDKHNRQCINIPTALMGELWNKSGTVYPHLHRRTGMAGHGRKSLRFFYRGTTRLADIDIQRATDIIDDSANTHSQLFGKDTSGTYMIVERCEPTRAVELCPAAINLIRASIGQAVGINTGSCALIGQTVGGVPTGSIFLQAKIGKLQVVAVNVHHIKQQTRGPRRTRTAKAERLLGVALHKGVGPCRTETGREVVDALFGIATLEKTFLTKHQECAAAHSPHFRHRLTGDAIFYRDLLPGTLHNNCRTGQMAEFDHPHPAVAGIGDVDAIPRMIFVHRP